MNIPELIEQLNEESEMNPLPTVAKNAAEAAVLEAQPTDQRLINLLCRIHRDGGHYIAEHGLDKAVEDADIRVAEQNAAFDVQSKQEPVAITCNEVTNTGYIYIKALDRTVPHGTKLYAAPVVQPDMCLLDAMKEVIRISDRKHEAWDLAKRLIAAAEGGT